MEEDGPAFSLGELDAWRYKQGDGVLGHELLSSLESRRFPSERSFEPQLYPVGAEVLQSQQVSRIDPTLERLMDLEFDDVHHVDQNDPLPQAPLPVIELLTFVSLLGPDAFQDLSPVHEEHLFLVFGHLAVLPSLLSLLDVGVGVRLVAQSSKEGRDLVVLDEVAVVVEPLQHPLFRVVKGILLGSVALREKDPIVLFGLFTISVVMRQPPPLNLVLSYILVIKVLKFFQGLLVKLIRVVPRYLLLLRSAHGQSFGGRCLDLELHVVN